MCVLLITREWEGGPVNQVNHTSWVAVVTPADRPESVRNCCLIELNFFVALFVLSLCPFDISVGVGAFVIGLGQISSFTFMLLIWQYRNSFRKHGAISDVSWHVIVVRFCMRCNGIDLPIGNMS